MFKKEELIVALKSVNINQASELAIKIQSVKGEVEQELRIENQQDLNKKTATHNGISVEVLICSSNYSKLVEEYQQHIFKLMVSKLAEKCGVSECLICGVMMLSAGKITTTDLE